MSKHREKDLPKAVKKLLSEGWLLDSNVNSTIRLLRKGSLAITYNVENNNVGTPWTWLNSDWQDGFEFNNPKI